MGDSERHPAEIPEVTKDWVDPDGYENGLLRPWEFRERHKGEEGWSYPFDPGPPYTRKAAYRKQ